MLKKWKRELILSVWKIIYRKNVFDFIKFYNATLYYTNLLFDDVIFSFVSFPFLY